MVAFYESNDTALWESALGEYSDRLCGLGKERLVELDEFYRVELVKALRERTSPAYVTKEEFIKIVDWKLSRGKWRPRLLAYAKDAAEDDIIETSKRAFSALPDVQLAIKILSELKGIGPATASAVLAAYRPDLAPFMSDEALAAALEGAKDYTPKKYVELTKALTAKAKQLGKKSTGKPWTPSDVERAIWSDDAKGRQKGAAKASSKASKTTADKKGGAPDATAGSGASITAEKAAPKVVRKKEDTVAVEAAPEVRTKRKKGSKAERNVRSKG